MRLPWITRQTLRCVVLGTWWFATVASSAHCDDAGTVKKTWRLYEAGPLKAEEFEASPPTGEGAARFAGMGAKTLTQLHYDVKYFITAKERSVEVKLTGITFNNYFDRSQSWKRPGMSQALLDHEQGHFDLTEIYARRATLLMADHVRKNKPLRVTRRTNKEAIDAMKKQISELLDPIYRDMHKAHADYDKTTRHGEVPDKQRSSREQQAGTLKSLKEQLEIGAERR